MLTICTTTTQNPFNMWQVARIPETAQLAEAHPLVLATQIAHSCLTTTLCQWTGKGNSETCGARITYESVPAHFGGTHGIRKLNADTSIYCRGDVINWLNESSSFGIFANVIWATIEKRSSPP